MLPVTATKAYEAIERQLTLMARDELTEAALTESKRRGSSEAAYCRGLAEGYRLALEVVARKLGVKPEPQPPPPEE